MDELDRQIDDIQDRIVEKIENTDWKEVGKKLWELIFEGLKSSAKLALNLGAKMYGIDIDEIKGLFTPSDGGHETGGGGGGGYRGGQAGGGGGGGHRDGSGATIVQNNYFSGNSTIADQEKANQRLAAALAK